MKYGSGSKLGQTDISDVLKKVDFDNAMKLQSSKTTLWVSFLFLSRHHNFFYACQTAVSTIARL